MKPAPKISRAQKKRFRATLEKLRSNLGWTIVRIPFDAKQAWGSGRAKVRGEVNGAEFRTSVFPQKNGESFLLINKQLQKAAGIVMGSSAEFSIEPDTAPREVKVPQELVRIFRQSKRLEKWFYALSYSYRREIARWITLSAGESGRQHRADQIAERLLETMEAERDLPPLIRTALDRDPLARAGWKHMTPIQKRGELMGVFYYRTPESRARRLEKMLDKARSMAEKL
jgi:uncharacterized protein YdeI (YjbR/CyaY-like superfamily)